MAEVAIDKGKFHERLGHLVSAWKADKRSGGDALFGGASSLLVLWGKTEDSGAYQKSNSIHLWLLGYEFPATLILLTTETIYFVTTAKKAKLLEPLKGGKIPLEVMVRGKDAEQNEKLFVKIKDTIKSAGKKIGTFPRDAPIGPFIDEWKKFYETFKNDVEEVDISIAISSAALAVKDESELRAMRNASKACIALITPYFVDMMSEILDEGKKTKHSALASMVEGQLDNATFWSTAVLPNKQKMPGDFDPLQLDWTIGPTIQSGGKFDLKLGAQANDDNLHAGVIIAVMGLRYKSYSSMIARTYMVDPDKSQESNYKFLVGVHDLVRSLSRDGAAAKDIYLKALAMVKSKKPELEKRFLKNVGYGMGIETRDNTLVLNAKSSRTLKDGMTLCITTGFSDIENPKPQDKQSKVYSLIITDTIRVTSSDPVIFTGDAPADVDANCFYFKDEGEDEAPAKSKEKKNSKVGAVSSENLVRTKLRADRNNQVDMGVEAKRAEHQKELAKMKQAQGLERFADAVEGSSGATKKEFKKFESYKRDTQFPARVRELSILVDEKSSTVILPIMGRPVPFHIQTIKNASKSDEGEFSFLRINFLSPGQGVGRKDDQPFLEPTAHFVRSLTFRSHDGERFNEIAAKIANMKKDATKREQEKKELEDVVEQDKLVEIRNRRPAVLNEAFIRPALDGKRAHGRLEIHQNGLRYFASNASHKVDVLFSNVKHIFFQPCEGELMVIIHLHLKEFIMIGKKKTKDVQFYKEATDMQFDETGNRKRKYRYGDDEEFEAEQDERRRRAELDKQVKKFADLISESCRSENIDIDIPSREAGFQGVPFRSNVFCMPTMDCLVQIAEPPFLVITVEDIEIAHLERVQFGLKNFDLVFIFKDFHRPPKQINTIPVESLETVKEWLDSVNIPFSEGPLNLNWPTIMKTVTSDPHSFFKDGGWGFLNADSDDEEEEESEESAFEISEEELAASDESSEDDSDFDEAASDDEGEDDGSDDSGGEDWDALEAKAKRKDRESGMGESEDEGPKKKRKH